jgi:DNA polymerase-1
MTPYGCDYAYVWDANALQRHHLREGVFALLEDPTIAKCGHNLKFDQINIESRFGITVRGYVQDTMLLRKMLESHVEGKLVLAQALVGMGGGKDEAAGYVAEGVKYLKKPTPDPTVAFDATVNVEIAVQRVAAGDDPKRYAYAAIPPTVRARYNATDTISTDRLRRHLDARAWEPGVRETWDAVMVPLHHAIVAMERTGIGVSRAAIGHLQVAMAARVAAAEETLLQYGNVNPNAPGDVAKLLFETLGLKPAGMTPTGKPTTDAQTLQNLKHPAATAILEYRRAAKFKTQFADGMESYIRDNGRIHASINLAGTESGRLSCSAPNLFNIPGRGTDDGTLCRNIFVAPEGSVILEADFMQSEIRLAALLSGDPVMTGFVQSGADFHLETAKLVAPSFGISPDDVTKDHWLRTASKTVNFAVLYGTGASALAMQLKINKTQAQKLMDAIFGKFHKLKQWIDQQIGFGRRKGYCRTYWHGMPARVRQLPAIGEANDEERSSAERASYNSIIQGSATEYTNASLGEIHRRILEEGLPAKLILTVYDSIMVEVEEGALAETAALVKEVMTGWPSGDVPMDVDMKSGRAWGALEKYEVE